MQYSGIKFEAPVEASAAKLYSILNTFSGEGSNRESETEKVDWEKGPGKFWRMWFNSINLIRPAAGLQSLEREQGGDEELEEPEILSQ